MTKKELVGRVVDVLEGTFVPGSMTWTTLGAKLAGMSYPDAQQIGKELLKCSLAN